jgi:hypothetical protein
MSYGGIQPNDFFPEDAFNLSPTGWAALSRMS